MKTVTVQRFLQMVTVLIYLSLSHTIIKSGCTIVSGESFNFTSNGAGKLKILIISLLDTEHGKDYHRNKKLTAVTID